MAINSKRKGKTGELEWAKFCREHGFDGCRRGQQYSGLEGEDVVGLPCIHCEVKRVEALNIIAAMQQSERDATPGQVPIVAHRRNRTPWLVTLPADKFLLMLNAILHNDRGAWTEACYGARCDFAEGDGRNQP